MTGTLAPAADALDQALPPRGMITSTNCGMAMRWSTTERSVVCTSCTPQGGSPAATSAC